MGRHVLRGVVYNKKKENHLIFARARRALTLYELIAAVLVTRNSDFKIIKCDTAVNTDV